MMNASAALRIFQQRPEISVSPDVILSMNYSIVIRIFQGISSIAKAVDLLLDIRDQSIYSVRH